jgi:hypothetical protein
VRKRNPTLLDLSLAVDPPPSRFVLLAAGSEGESVLSNWNLKSVTMSLNVMSSLTAHSGEKSASENIYSSRKLADKVVPGYNIPRRRSFDWRTDRTTLVVERLQFVIIGAWKFDMMIQDVEKVGYRPLTLQ